MWRCKWLELQMRKLRSQELKYDKELEAYDYKKRLEFSKYAVDGFDVKSIPISNGIRRNKVMKRKKRKRAEECDLASYVSNHAIFSYYGMSFLGWLHFNLPNVFLPYNYIIFHPILSLSR